MLSLAGSDVKGRYLLYVALDELHRGDLLSRQTLLQLQPHRLVPLRPADTHTHTHTIRHTHLQTREPPPPPTLVVYADALCLRVVALREEKHLEKKKTKNPNASETKIHMKEKHSRENKHRAVEVMQISPPPSQLTAAATLRPRRRRVYLYSALFFLLFSPAEEVPAVPYRGRRATQHLGSPCPPHPPTPRPPTHAPPGRQDNSAPPAVRSTPS